MRGSPRLGRRGLLCVVAQELPKLARYARPTRISIRHSAAFRPKRLFRNADGCERLIPFVEVLLADDPAGPKAVEREKRSVHCDAAAFSLPSGVSDHKHPVPGVDHLLEMNFHLPGWAIGSRHRGHSCKELAIGHLGPRRPIPAAPIERATPDECVTGAEAA